MEYVFDEKPSLNDLTHYGTKGMRWGVRKGKGKTGVSRTGQSRIEKNNRLIKSLNAKKSGTGGRASRASAAIGKKIVGEQQFKSNLNTSIKRLSSQNSRITTGKTTIDDKLQMAMTTSVLNLVVSRS